MLLQDFRLGSLLAEASEHEISFWGLFMYFLLVLAILVVILSMAKKSFGEKVFKKWPAQLFEQAYLFVEKLCLSTIGPHGRKYVPFIMTLWLVIFVGNSVALFMASSPTEDLSFNLGMALIAVGYAQWEGMRTNGVLGHLGHFAGPKLATFADPKTWLFFLITILLFCIEIISELMKNVSLSLRLFGNIDGGHKAVEAMNNITSGALIPLGAFLMPIKILTVIVQALIFCLLSCVYLGMVTSHASDDHAHGETAPAH
ncbi:MAG TPA: F0F1 ATP synthase subunit A [Fimbriimonadaceae bacterium]|nr:F0F1 ATP synthase subunit A [Fimbriimonadaceae bacterium]